MLAVMSEGLISLGRNEESDMNNRKFYLESMFEVKGEYEKFSHILSWIFCFIPVMCQALKQYDHI